jgi:hypothetical protein
MAEPGTGADALQRPLRCRFRARLTAGVRPIKEETRRMRSQVLKVFLFMALPVVIVFCCGGVPGDALAASQIPTVGLVAYYPFNGNTNDASGNGFHCTPHGAVLTSDRAHKPNSAYAFNGVDAYIECPTSPRLGVHVGVDMTVSTWVKPAKFASSVDNKIIISKYRHFVPENSDFYVGLHLNNDEIPPAQVVVTGMGFDAVLGNPPRFNKWSHIAVVYRGTVGNASVYLNGNLLGTGPLTYNGRGARPCRNASKASHVE